MYTNSKLKFNKDTIYSETYNRNIMWRSLSNVYNKHAEIVCQFGGDILEIGFGMGVFSDHVQKYDIKSHTIVESHPQIFEKLQDWAKNKKNVTILNGTWYSNWDNISIKQYDGVFYDASPDKEKHMVSSLLDICMKKKSVFSNFNPLDENFLTFDNKIKYIEIKCSLHDPNFRIDVYKLPYYIKNE